MQSLDVSVYGPFKAYFSAAQTDWLLSHPGKVINILHIVALASKAYYNAFTIKSICSSFKAAGHWPVNSPIFSDTDFLSSFVTDKLLNEENNSDAVLNPHVEENSQSPQLSTSKAIVEPDRIERNTPCIIR
ncbi:hypothetical protein ILUMI_02943 [Ignelater luminosus]|uniref:Uncharacterized protein n=1 Tax=Ignelater luminosus TaxID=2038154 RepID=A0A8K0DHG3_IGNLU|nr:hypothetical protein ILUMI_02943 [Ignelater luminosus]